MAIVIFKGADAKVTVTLKDKKTKEPIDLSGFTGATAYFAQQDSEDPVSVTGSLLSSDCGKIEFNLSDTETPLLDAGDEQNMEVVVDQGALRTIVQFEGEVSIKERLF